MTIVSSEHYEWIAFPSHKQKSYMPMLTSYLMLEFQSTAQKALCVVSVRWYPFPTPQVCIVAIHFRSVKHLDLGLCDEPKCWASKHVSLDCIHFIVISHVSSQIILQERKKEMLQDPLSGPRKDGTAHGSILFLLLDKFQETDSMPFLLQAGDLP